MPKKRHWFFDSYKYQVRTGTVPEFPHGHVIRTHSHPWHQLVYASQGVMTVRTPEGAWVVPIHRGVWVPAGTRHLIQMSGPVSMRTLYLVPRLARTRNLRRLDLDVLIAVLLDHLQVMKSDAIHLPLPRDARAKRIAAALQERPADLRSLSELSKLAGASKRTIERVFRRETGMGFGKWRQQLRLGHAMRLLAAGDAVTNVALDVGYDSVSAFITMFRTMLGATPRTYLRSTPS